MSTLQRFRKNVYSQNGEDGVIAEIILRIGLEPGWTCEVGAWDGRYGSNCYALVKKGWLSLMIEGDRHRFKHLEQLSARTHDRIRPINAYVDYHDGPNTLDNILANAGVPPDLRLLSIDIDSYDYQVWNGFSGRAAIVVIEIDSSTPPGESYIYCGHERLTSFSAMLSLARSKNYTLACHTGNMIFVHNDYVGRLALPASEIENPESLFVWDWVNPARAQRWMRKVRYMTPQRAWVKCVNAMRGSAPDRKWGKGNRERGIGKRDDDAPLHPRVGNEDVCSSSTRTQTQI